MNFNKKHFPTFKLNCSSVGSAECWMIGIVYDERMQLHHHPEDDPLNDYCAKTDHPESPLRISSIYAHLNARGLVERCASVPAVSALRSDLVRAHGAAHCDFVASLSSAAVRDALGNALFDESSVYVNDHTPMAASLSAGSVVALTEAVVDGRLDAGFAIVRPPGHHAEPGACHGFCLYNNVAVAAKAARERMDVAVSFVKSNVTNKQPPNPCGRAYPLLCSFSLCSRRTWRLPLSMHLPV